MKIAKDKLTIFSPVYLGETSIKIGSSSQGIPEEFDGRCLIECLDILGNMKRAPGINEKQIDLLDTVSEKIRALYSGADSEYSATCTLNEIDEDQLDEILTHYDLFSQNSDDPNPEEGSDFWYSDNTVYIRMGPGSNNCIGIDRDRFEKIQKLLESSKDRDLSIYGELSRYKNKFRAYKKRLEYIRSEGNEIELPEEVSEILLGDNYNDFIEGENLSTVLHELEKNRDNYVDKYRDSNGYWRKNADELGLFHDKISSGKDHDPIEQLIKKMGKKESSLITIDDKDEKMVEYIAREAKEYPDNIGDIIKKYSGHPKALMLIYRSLLEKGRGAGIRRIISDVVLNSKEYKEIIDGVSIPSEEAFNELISTDEAKEISKISSSMNSLLTSLVESVKNKEVPQNSLIRKIKTELSEYKEKVLGSQAGDATMDPDRYSDGNTMLVEKILREYDKYIESYDFMTESYKYGTFSTVSSGVDDRKKRKDYLEYLDKYRQDMVQKHNNTEKNYSIVDINDYYQTILDNVKGVGVSFKDRGKDMEYVKTAEDFKELENMIDWFSDENNTAARICLFSKFYKDDNKDMNRIYKNMHKDHISTHKSLESVLDSVDEKYSFFKNNEGDRVLEDARYILSCGNEKWYESFNKFYESVVSMAEIPKFDEYIKKLHSENKIYYRWKVWRRIIENKFKLSDLTSLTGGSLIYSGTHTHNNKTYCVFSKDSRFGREAFSKETFDRMGMTEGDQYIIIDINYEGAKEVKYKDLPGFSDDDTIPPGGGGAGAGEAGEERAVSGEESEKAVIIEELREEEKRILGEEGWDVGEDQEYTDSPDTQRVFNIEDKDAEEEQESLFSDPEWSIKGEEEEEYGEESPGYLEGLFDDPEDLDDQYDDQEEDPKIGSSVGLRISSDNIKIAELVDPKFKEMDPEELGMFGVVGLGIEMDALRRLIVSGSIFDMFGSDFVITIHS